MKGIIFDVAAEVVRDTFGDDAWDDLLDAVGSDGAFTALGSYPDSDLVAIIEAASDHLRVPASDVTVMIGRSGYAILIGRYPGLVADLPDLRTCLASLNTIIHPEVLKLYPGANPPTFELHPDGPDLLLHYISERGMCRLAEGLALGAADAFGEPVTVTHDSCRTRGDSSCILRLRWSDGDEPD